MILAALALTWLAVSPQAHASRPARIDVENAEVYEGPNRGSRLLEKLPKGTPVAVSNIPTEGFFKLRTPGGTVGWISSDSLILMDPNNPEPAPVMLPDSAPAAPPPVNYAPGGTNDPLMRTDRGGRKAVRLRGFFGVDLFNAEDINTLFQFSSLKFGFNYGGELNFYAQPDLSVTLRFEIIAKDIVANDVSSGKTYQLSIRSIPITAGLDIELSRSSKWSTKLGLLAGLAVNTSFEARAIYIPETVEDSNLTRVNSSTFSGQVRILADHTFSRSLSLYVEAGYRILKTAAATPSKVGDGAEIFQVDPTSTSAVYQALSIDLGGPYAAGGISISL